MFAYVRKFDDNYGQIHFNKFSSYHLKIIIIINKIIIIIKIIFFFSNSLNFSLNFSSNFSNLLLRSEIPSFISSISSSSVGYLNLWSRRSFCKLKIFVSTISDLEFFAQSIASGKNPLLKFRELVLFDTKTQRVDFFG